MTPPIPAALDTSRPNLARLYSYLLGGNDAYRLDAELGNTLTHTPLIAGLHQARQFVQRATRYLAEHHNVHQLVDLGCGYPDHTAIPTNQPDTRTLYIDNDALVAVHARALLRGETTFFAEVDLTDTDTVLDQITTTMDTDKPLALCLSGTAEFLPEAPAVLHRLTEGLPAGTWVVLTHTTGDTPLAPIETAAMHLTEAGIPFQVRCRDEIHAMLDRYQLLEPGLVPAPHWRPDQTHTGFASSRENPCVYGAVGHRRR